MSQAELARRLGKHQSSVWAWERGDYAPSRGIMVALAKALNTSPNWLEFESDGLVLAANIAQVPVRGVVQAGLWAELLEDSSDAVTVPMSLPANANLDHFAIVNISDSHVSKKAPLGSSCLCQAADVFPPVHEDFVIVRRLNSENLAELTCKQYLERGSTKLLRFYSDDPRWGTDETILPDDDRKSIEWVVRKWIIPESNPNRVF